MWGFSSPFSPETSAPRQAGEDPRSRPALCTGFPWSLSLQVRQQWFQVTHTLKQSRYQALRKRARPVSQPLSLQKQREHFLPQRQLHLVPKPETSPEKRPQTSILRGQRHRNLSTTPAACGRRHTTTTRRNPGLIQDGAAGRRWKLFIRLSSTCFPGAWIPLKIKLFWSWFFNTVKGTRTVRKRVSPGDICRPHPGPAPRAGVKPRGWLWPRQTPVEAPRTLHPSLNLSRN